MTGLQAFRHNFQGHKSALWWARPAGCICTSAVNRRADASTDSWQWDAAHDRSEQRQPSVRVSELVCDQCGARARALVCVCVCVCVCACVCMSACILAQGSIHTKQMHRCGYTLVALHWLVPANYSRVTFLADVFGTGTRTLQKRASAERRPSNF